MTTTSRHPTRQRKTSSLRHLKSVVFIVALVVGALLVHGRHSSGDAAVIRINSDPSIARVKTSDVQVSSAWKAAEAALKPVVTKPATPKPTAPTAASETTTSCAQNSSGQLVLVSISKRHMWACNGSTQAYDSPVVTGMEFLAADLTPTGTYHISAKYTDRDLKGSDSTGSWDDHVSYWMPWLHNQYGNYGFHDATWRDPNAFGNIDPNTSDASHGCVELPLATAAWLYNWSAVGTTVKIEA